MSLSPATASAGLLVAALVVVSTARAQETFFVEGLVLQEGTGAPVEGALVTIEGRPGGAVTDETGAFAFDGLPTGLLRFRIERLGFWTTVLPTVLESSTSLLFRVASKPIVAERIEVVIDVLEGRRNALPYATRTFGPERLRAHLALDTDEFLRRRAGLSLVPCREGSFGGSVPGPPECISHRGRAVPARVWIDERPAFGGFDALIGYPVTEIHSVEVIGGCAMVRVYTRRFMDAVASGQRRLFPVLVDCTIG